MKGCLQKAELWGFEFCLPVVGGLWAKMCARVCHPVGLNKGADEPALYACTLPFINWDGRRPKVADPMRTRSQPSRSPIGVNAIQEARML